MKVLFVLFVLFALCSCKLIPKIKSVGREINLEGSLLRLEYRGSCADFRLIAPTITANPIDYTSTSLTSPADAPASATKGCLPFYLTANGVPTDYDNLVAHYVCTSVGKDLSIIDIVEVFNNDPPSFTVEIKNRILLGYTISIVDNSNFDACQALCISEATCIAFYVDGSSVCRTFILVVIANDDATCTAGYVTRTSSPVVDEHSTVPFILGVTSNRPFRTSQAIPYRRPTCGTTKKFCQELYVVNSCFSNSPSFKKSWIVNKDVVYLLPNTYSSSAPSDCKSSTVCCSYLPSDEALTAYISNTVSGYCIAPTNNKLLKLEREKEEYENHKDDDKRSEAPVKTN